MPFKFLNKTEHLLTSTSDTKKLFLLNSRNYRLLFIGPPGVGKGTFAKIVGPQLDAQIIDTGSILRKIVSSQQSLTTNYNHHTHTHYEHQKYKNNYTNFTQYSLTHHHTNYTMNVNDININHQSINHTHTDACNNICNEISNIDNINNNSFNNNSNNVFNYISLETKKLIQTYMTKGELIPDNVLLPIMLSYLKSCKSSLILDGFPRTLSQIKWLYEHHFHFNLAILFHLPDRILITKMLGRRVCKNCDNTYNVANIDEINDEKLGIKLPLLTPKKEDKCDKCNGNLICRSEDTAHTLQHRMSIYHQQTEPIIEFLKENNPNLLLNFDIKKGVDDSNLLLSLIKEKLQNSAIPK